MTPIVRVARAIMNHCDCDPDVFVGMHGSYGHWLDEARTAIEAMREPSEKMVDAGRSAQGISDADDLLCWSAMIDAALEEGTADSVGKVG